MKPSEIQKAVADALAGDKTLAAARIGASIADDGSLAAKLSKALGVCGSGIHAIVGAPRFTPESSAAKNAVGTLTLDVAVTEVPAVNRKRAGHLTGADAAWRVAWTLNQLKLSPDGVLLVLAGTVQSTLEQDGSAAVYTIPFKCLNSLI